MPTSRPQVDVMKLAEAYLAIAKDMARRQEEDGQESHPRDDCNKAG
ncbi:hypothetical protein [Arthrobacter sp. CJ23]|nr:hypothetical protein [Arthrobacter sp. CJ23]UVJ38017.1 hypothetical protein NVV90_12175 [Arthrobacter sp. CJ23]